MGVQRYLFLPASFLSFIFSTFLSFLLIPCLISSRIQRFLTFFSIRWVLSLSGTQQILIFSLFVGLFRFLAPNDSCFFLFSLGYFASYQLTILAFTMRFSTFLARHGTKSSPLSTCTMRFPTFHFPHGTQFFKCLVFYHELPILPFSSWYKSHFLSVLIP